MKQIITILLKPEKKVESIRKKYDKGYGKFKPHINLVYPFELKNQDKLIEHIKNSIVNSNVKPFKLIMKGIEKSKKDYYLYLLVSKGKNEIMSLYKKLNSGILKDFKNKDMPKYIPHLTLGVFEDKKNINNAIIDITKINPMLKMKVDSIQLLTLNKDWTIKSVKRFKFR